MTKDELRKISRDKRSALSREEVEIGSQKIAALFFKEINISPNNMLHIFLPIRKLNEINTFHIINPLKKAHNSSICFPRIKAGTNEMEHILLDKTTCLEENSFGIPEPMDGQRIASKDIDIVLIPLLAFDTLGYRLGYGKGFYDKFIAECSPKTQFIGLSLFAPEAIPLPKDSWDMPIHACITPTKVYRFNSFSQ